MKKQASAAGKKTRGKKSEPKSTTAARKTRGRKPCPADPALDRPLEEIRALLAKIPDGLDQFLVDDNFLEDYKKSLVDSGYDRAVYDQAKAGLTLFPDRGKLARKTRLLLKEAGREDLIDTQREYIQARNECSQSTETAYASYVVSLKRACERLLDVVARLREESFRREEELQAHSEAELAKRDRRIKELEDSMGQALNSAFAAHPDGAKSRRRRRDEEDEEVVVPGQERVSRKNGFLLYRADAFEKFIPEESDRLEFATRLHEAPSLNDAIAFTDAFADGNRMQHAALLDKVFQRLFFSTLHPECKSASVSNVLNKLTELGKNKLQKPKEA